MELLDTYGRIARDLRLSVTDRCSLRCHYCMPAEGVPLIPRPELLTADEMVRLAGIAVGDLGVSRIRVTGGEPLVRRDLAAIVERLADLTPRPELALTTNGVGLAGRAHELARAGLDRVTVSLDTLDPTTFATLARRDRLSDVLAAIRAAVALWPGRVKINAVALPETLAEAPALLDFARSVGAELRFIEGMPFAAGSVERVVTAADILAELGRHVTLTPDEAGRDKAPAERWRVDGGPDRVGVIASVTRPFCRDCERTRLTSDGMVRSCLFDHVETDLRTPMRAGATDAVLAAAWQAAMWAKPAGHRIGAPDFRPPERPMSAIGG